MASSLRKMPKTSILRLILPLRRSTGLVEHKLDAMLLREGHVAGTECVRDAGNGDGAASGEIVPSLALQLRF